MSSPVKRFNIAAGRPYTTRDGEEKKQWINLGRATQWDDGGISLELTAMPVGSWFDGKASLFEQDDSDKGKKSAAPSKSSGDDIPF